MEFEDEERRAEASRAWLQQAERRLKIVTESGSPQCSEEELEAVQALVTCLVESDPRLKKIHAKSMTRSLEDRKVAPGSGSVARSIVDARYCLCLLHVKLGKHYELQSETYEQAISSYQKALIWYPYSVEAGYLLGLCLRSQAITDENLEFVRFLWERSVESIRTLEENLPTLQSKIESSDLAAVELSVISILLSESILSTECVEPSHLSALVQKGRDILIYREREVSNALVDALILYYCQESQIECAVPLLLWKRYQWKLSQKLLAYGLDTPENSPSRLRELQARSDFPFTFGYDSILPLPFLNRLQHVFRPSSPFWSEHQYDFYSNCSRAVGYFSYLYLFREKLANNVVEQVIDIIYRTLLFHLESKAKSEDLDCKSQRNCLNALKSEATVAEWWVHSRPHSSGHQFHYDSDETALYGGEHAQHPIVSCIVYLTEGVGGPTVVSNQTLSSPNLASYGFLLQPKENRLAVFDSTFLHGVLPGRGLCPQTERVMLGENKTCDEVSPRRRLSFMVGFWRKIKAKDRGPGCPGPGQPFPNLDHHYTWPNEMKEMLPVESHEDEKIVNSSSTCSCNIGPIVQPQLIEPIWEKTVCSDGEMKEENICAQYATCFQGF